MFHDPFRIAMLVASFAVSGPSVLDATETKVAGAGVGVALAPATGHVARAVLVGAEVRPALHDALGGAGLGGAAAVGRALRVHREVRLPRQTRVVVRAVPVGAPLPHVAGHGVQAVAVGRERADGGGTSEAVSAGVLVGE